MKTSNVIKIDFVKMHEERRLKRLASYKKPGRFMTTCSVTLLLFSGLFLGITLYYMTH